MFIIVEGPDGAGKTTLVKKLQHQFDSDDKTFKLVHFGRIDDPSKYFDLYFKTIKDAEGVDVTVFDRSWYSDRVYGPVMRGQEEMTFENARKLDQAIFTYGGGMIIYCDSPISILWQRCRERGETYITDVRDLSKIATLYRQEIEASNLPVVYYDTSLGF